MSCRAGAAPFFTAPAPAKIAAPAPQHWMGNCLVGSAHIGQSRVVRYLVQIQLRHFCKDCLKSSCFVIRKSGHSRLQLKKLRAAPATLLRIEKKTSSLGRNIHKESPVLGIRIMYRYSGSRKKFRIQPDPAKNPIILNVRKC